MKLKVISICLILFASFSASAKMLTISGIDEVGDMLDKNVVVISQDVKTKVCVIAANDSRTEQINLVVVKSAELTRIKGMQTFVVDTPVSSMDAGFNHWRYACDSSELVKITQQYRVEFVLSDSSDSISIEVPELIQKSNVKVEAVPQPMYSPIVEPTE